MDEVITPDLASLLYRNLRDYVIREKGPQAVEKGLPAPELARIGPKYRSGQPLEAEKDHSMNENKDEDEPIDLAQLQQAYEHRVLYILGNEELIVKRETKIGRGLLLRMFLFLRDYSRSKMSNIKVPTDRLVELGFIKEM